MALGKVKELTTLFAAGLLMGGIGCGDAGSNNDQGTAVTAVGFCGDVMCDTGETGRIVQLSSDVSQINSGNAPLDGQLVITYLEVANRLAGQFVRVDRVDCEYLVPGSDPSLRIPNDSFAVGAVIEENPLGGTESTGVLGFEIVSPDLFAFLNANRASLPELPFRAVATCEAVAVTQAGDTITTNPLNYTIQFGEVSECCTGQGSEAPGQSTGGFQQGTGTGGDLNTFGNENSLAGAEGSDLTDDGSPLTGNASTDDASDEMDGMDLGDTNTGSAVSN